MATDQTPLNTNGHDLMPRRADAVQVLTGTRSGEPIVIGARFSCASCDQTPTYVLREGAVHVQDPCPYPMGITTEITLDVPSGKLIVTDDLRDVYDVDFDAGANYGSALGKKQVIEAMAALGCAFGNVNNTCPGLYRQGANSYVIAAPVRDDNDVPSLPDEACLAEISTELWAYSIADFDDWKAKGGHPGNRLLGKYTVVDVTPGTYKFTYHGAERGFDHHAADTVVFAHIERVPTPAS
ncbi:hypothetical protein ACWDBD_44240 [Streptomyces sp. NPDC001118]